MSLTGPTRPGWWTWPWSRPETVDRKGGEHRKTTERRPRQERRTPQKTGVLQKGNGHGTLDEGSSRSRNVYVDSKSLSHDLGHWAPYKTRGRETHQNVGTPNKGIDIGSPLLVRADVTSLFLTPSFFSYLRKHLTLCVMLCYLSLCDKISPSCKTVSDTEPT